MFGNPEKYTAVLDRIAIFSFGFMCAATWTLFHFARFAPGPMVKIPFIELSIPVIWLGGIVVASIIFRMIKLHDLISDLFRIRERYDIREIILPLLQGSSPTRITPEAKTLKEKRREIMRDVFYRYVPGPPGTNKISDHLVGMAWESLCWLWIITEAAVIALVFAGIAICLDGNPATLIFWLAFLVTLALYFVASSHCRKQTSAEVEAILADAGRRDEIRRSFDEILG